MADILEHLRRRGANIDLVRRAADSGHQAARLRQRAIAGRKTGHRIGQQIVPRTTETIDRLRAYEQRLGRIDSA